MPTPNPCHSAFWRADWYYSTPAQPARLRLHSLTDSYRAVQGLPLFAASFSRDRLLGAHQAPRYGGDVLSLTFRMSFPLHCLGGVSTRGLDRLAYRFALCIVTAQPAPARLAQSTLAKGLTTSICEARKQAARPIRRATGR